MCVVIIKDHKTIYLIPSTSIHFLQMPMLVHLCSMNSGWFFSFMFSKFTYHRFTFIHVMKRTKTKIFIDYDRTQIVTHKNTHVDMYLFAPNKSKMMYYWKAENPSIRNQLLCMWPVRFIQCYFHTHMCAVKPFIKLMVVLLLLLFSS